MNRESERELGREKDGKYQTNECVPTVTIRIRFKV